MSCVLNGSSGVLKFGRVGVAKIFVASFVVSFVDATDRADHAEGSVILSDRMTGFA